MLFTLLAAAGGRAAAYSSLEEKVRYEAALEQKGDEILMKVLGPNQARVSVEVVLKMEKSAGGEAGSQFAWLGAAQKKEKMKELLPGYTAPISVAPMAEGEARAYSFNVERLTVTIVASSLLGQAEVTEMINLAERVMGLDRKRGDTIDVVRASFSPAWKAMLYSPEAAGLLFKYGVVGLVVILSFTIIGAGILRLAGAMGSMAKAQEHEVSIGFSGAGKGDTEGGGGPAQLEGPGQAVSMTMVQGRQEEPFPRDEGPGKVVFNVKLEQLPVLVNMLKKEDPENISLVVYHLPEEVRGELLSNLGRDLATKVMINLATVRFVEREMVEEIKEELEKRLNSAVGGIGKVIEMIAPMRYTERKEIIKQFEQYNPPLAAELRREVILDEDLLSITDKEVGELVSAIQVSQWAEYFPSLQQELRNKITAQLPPKSVLMIEQTLKYATPSAQQLDDGIDKLMAVVSDLVKKGKIRKPAQAGKLIAADAPAAGAAGAAAVAAVPAETKPAPGAKPAAKGGVK